jgi:DNA-binding MarR family transcriptional regulator
MPSGGKQQKRQIRPQDCSARLLEVVLPIMRRIRSELRSNTMKGLTVPQFRTLNFLRRHPDASLSQVSDHLGLTPPTVSKMIQKLVEEGIILRDTAQDRRQVRLSLSAEGVSALKRAMDETRKQLAENLRTLSQDELITISSALELLEQVFSKDNTGVNIS